MSDRIKVSELRCEATMEMITMKDDREDLPARSSAVIKMPGRVDFKASFLVSDDEIRKIPKTGKEYAFVASLAKFDAEDDRGFLLDGCVVTRGVKVGGVWRFRAQCDAITKVTSPMEEICAKAARDFAGIGIDVSPEAIEAAVRRAVESS